MGTIVSALLLLLRLEASLLLEGASDVELSFEEESFLRLYFRLFDERPASLEVLLKFLSPPPTPPPPVVCKASLALGCLGREEGWVWDR